VDDQLVQAYIWQEVIHLAFSPSSIKDRKTWLHRYQMSLRDFWEIDAFLPTPKVDQMDVITGTASNSTVEFEYRIKQAGRFSVAIYAITAGYRDLLWLHDVDESYLSFPNQLLLTQCNMRDAALHEFKKRPREHMIRVVDGLIAHPTVHQHIKLPIEVHEIRIGGGIVNPFLYLFQLRYQLTPKYKERERERLVELFTHAIIENLSSVSAFQLMEIPK
jgi:hypothetical protein